MTASGEGVLQVTQADREAAAPIFRAYGAENYAVLAEKNSPYIDGLLIVQTLSLRAAQATAEERERRETLFEAIRHGDEDHQAWLREAIAAHFAGQPVPEPRGQGNKAARIEALEEALRQAAHNLETGARFYFCPGLHEAALLARQALGDHP